RAGAVKALGSRKDPGHLPVLTKVLLSDSNRTVKANAIDAISDLGRDASTAIPALIRVIELEPPDAESPLVGSLAGDALIGIGPDAVPSILQALTRKEKKTESRETLAYAVEQIMGRGDSKRMQDSLPSLIELLDDTDEGVRRYITGAVACLGV